MLRMLTMSHVILHDEISKLHEYLDYSSELLTRIQANEPFTLDDFDLEEVADIVGEIDSLKPTHRRGDRGYL
jgi:hypothetical protein